MPVYHSMKATDAMRWEMRCLGGASTQKRKRGKPSTFIHVQMLDPHTNRLWLDQPIRHLHHQSTGGRGVRRKHGRADGECEGSRCVMRVEGQEY